MAIGDVLYTRFVFLFEMSGLILLVAMIGAIALTLRQRGSGRRRQSIAVQNAREPSTTLVMVKAKLGAGIDDLGVYRPLPEKAPAEEPALVSAPEDEDPLPPHDEPESK